jgi:outer membrane protein assembly factor BamE (lipoprotein component of BamABCDE complex)
LQHLQNEKNMNLQLKMELMNNQHSKTESKMAAGISTAALEKRTPAKASATSSALTTRRSTVEKLIKWEQKNLAIREDIIKGMQEEIVEIDAFIKAKFEATGETDPEDAKLRRKLVRQLNETKKLFFPKPKVLTDAERAEALVALQSWHEYREALLKEQPVSH